MFGFNLHLFNFFGLKTVIQFFSGIIIVKKDIKEHLTFDHKFFQTNSQKPIYFTVYLLSINY